MVVDLPEHPALAAQSAHWEKTYASSPELFGPGPSEPAKYAAKLFRANAISHLLELGAGQGRDTLFFAHAGFSVLALDYSETGLTAIRKKASAQGLAGRVETLRHDVRQPLPFASATLDACYAHMLFCMALTFGELAFLSGEIRRVLQPGGLCVYTVRSVADPHYRKGIHRSEDMYEMNGFIVHFFSREKILALAEGLDLADIAECEEEALPRKLFRVTLRKR